VNVLIIAKTRQEFEACKATYDRAWDRKNSYHWIRTMEQMRGFQMPVQIRFVGDWHDLEDAPTLEEYAEWLTSPESHGR
jgi:hypothetical protein